MSGKMDYEKVARQERVGYRPSWRTQPATQPQLDYIQGLAARKGQPRPKLPKTKHGAGEVIERLLDLPDSEVRQFARAAGPPANQARAELLIELRESFPSLSPMTVNSLRQLINAVDELAMYMFFADLTDQITIETPQEPEELIPWILRAFLDWLG